MNVVWNTQFGDDSYTLLRIWRLALQRGIDFLLSHLEAILSHVILHLTRMMSDSVRLHIILKVKYI